LIDVILSLTRTSRVGYLRDIRRLTVALSRARLGLYILGRREVFESCFELRQAFDILLQRPDKLMLVTGELFPSSRTLEEGAEVPGEVEMANLEHLGQYVYEMTNSKVQQVSVADMSSIYNLSPMWAIADSAIVEGRTRLTRWRVDSTACIGG
jgi:intron-binding protein aquarius